MLKLIEFYKYVAVLVLNTGFTNMLLFWFWTRALQICCCFGFEKRALQICCCFGFEHRLYKYVAVLVL